GSGAMREVVIYDFSDPERPRTVYADSGNLALTPDEKDLALELYDGVVREFPQQGFGGNGGGLSMAGDGSSASFQQTFFERQRVLVRDVGNQLQRTDEAGDQIKSDREQSICELQRNYVRFAREYDATYAELRELAARVASDGREATVPPKRRTYEKNGLGALYCRLVDALGVPTAFAAAPAAQDTTTARSVPADSTGAVAPAGGLPAGGLPAAAGVPEMERELSERDTRISDVLLDAARLRVTSSMQSANRYDVEIQKKFALAVACIVFVLLGAPIALRFPRGGVGLVIGVSLAVFGLYYVGLIAGETMADKGYLPPWAAMWAANILFTGAGLVLLSRMGKEGATARGGDLGELWDGVRGTLAGIGRRVGIPLERRRRRSAP
ncbi:MAG TPA: LptF/LptG family permease, partial [Gemmatimonadales bacterium]